MDIGSIGNTHQTTTRTVIHGVEQNDATTRTVSRPSR